MIELLILSIILYKILIATVDLHLSVNVHSLRLISLAALMTVILSFPLTQSFATTDVKWKTFKEKNGFFTIKYPSNWSPYKDTENSEYASPIDMRFYYTGGSDEFASVGVLAEEAIFTNVSDSIDSIYASVQSLSRYKLVEPMECTKYLVKETIACSTMYSYRNTEVSGKPTINELDIVTIADDGVQYLVYYSATKNVFDDFLPVAEEMVKSFTVTGNILSAGDESSLEGTEDSPALPPLPNSSISRL